MKPTIVVLEPHGGSTRHHNPELPLIYCDDAAVTRGDGIFESLLVRQGRVCNVQRHIDRFRASAQMLDLPAPDPQHWERATQEAIQSWRETSGDAEGMCVWTLTRGRASTGRPTAWITIKPLAEEVLDQRRNGVRVMTTPRGYSITTGLPDDLDDPPAPWLAVSAKTLSYAANMAALRYAKANGFDDVIYVEGGRVLEGATSTVVAVRGTTLLTPNPNGEILAGTTQAALYAHATWKGWKCYETELGIIDLIESDSVWLISSGRIAACVTAINEVELRDPGEKANAHFFQMVETALGWVNA
ncbi:MAG: aminodeoxychorismate lyase [Corynebacterium sp.]|nr:aminodeoxychorismate lyase [Corynebacterium sp.]